MSKLLKMLARPIRGKGNLLGPDPLTRLAKMTGSKTLIKGARSPLNVPGAYQYSLQTMGKELGRPGALKDWKSMIQATKRAHQEARDPSGRTAKMWNQIYYDMSSNDPAVRARAQSLWMNEKKKAEIQAQNDTRIAATVAAIGYGLTSAPTGEAAAGGGAGAGGGETTLLPDIGTTGYPVGTTAEQGLADIGVPTDAGLTPPIDPTTMTGAPSLAPTTPPPTTAPPTTPPPTTQTPISPWLKYGGPVAGMLASKLIGGGGGVAKGAQGQLGRISAEQQAIGEDLLNRYKSGTLEPGTQAAIDQYTQESKAAIRQQMANMGISDSTMETQLENKIDRNALIQYQGARDQMLNQGLAALGYATGPASTVLQAQLNQDAALQNAWGNAASMSMMLMAMGGT